MRIAIFTIGTEGDVRPLLALGLGLKQAGHDVLIATDQSCAGLVTGHGIRYEPLCGDFLSWMRSDQATLKKGLGMLTVLKEAKRRLKTMAGQWAEQGLSAAKGADLIIGNGMVYYLAESIGKKLGIPVVETQLMPTLPSETPPPLALPRWMQNLPPFANRALGRISRLMVWNTVRPTYNDIVRPALGLPAYPALACYQRRFIEHPRLFGFSPNLIPAGKQWPTQTAVTGAWFLDQKNWEPGPQLQHFLEQGPPPVYIGFGSMVHYDAEGFTAMVLEAATQTGERVILATGWGGLNAVQPGNDRIFVIDRAPHDWLFPRVSMAVHHGGAGTTSAAARAGIPSIFVPVFGDQPFWAARLEALGAAPPALPRETLTATTLAEAIRMAKSASMRSRAHSLGEKVRAENGVAAAISALHRWGLLNPVPTKTAYAADPKQPLAASPSL